MALDGYFPTSMPSKLKNTPHFDFTYFYKKIDDLKSLLNKEKDPWYSWFSTKGRALQAIREIELAFEDRKTIEPGDVNMLRSEIRKIYKEHIEQLGAQHAVSLLLSEIYHSIEQTFILKVMPIEMQQMGIGDKKEFKLD